ncbi:MAG: mRNA surveillance protein pelota [Nanoarchaeota archaeon]|nr:mRNA surveillance protein pelota [Nanoarchaeota archaeon]
MIVTKKDLKAGTLSVTLQAADDLWHLSHIMEPGDLVTAKTLRTTTIKQGAEFKKGDKVPMILTIRLEKLEFTEGSEALRLSGTIEQGPEDVQLHSYHTLTIEVRSHLTIQKSWNGYQLDRIERSRIKQPLLVVVAIDRDEATVALLRESGIEWKASLQCKGKKDIKDEGDREAFHKQIAAVLQEQPADVKAIVLAGPGFEKDHVQDYLKKNTPELGEKTVTEKAADAGRHGVQEVVQQSSQRILKETRIAKETGYLKIFFTELRKEGLVVYGPKETQKALEYGAVELLLVSEHKIKDFDAQLQQAEKTGATIKFVSADHEAGEQFLALGGIGGILRYKVH